MTAKVLLNFLFKHWREVIVVTSLLGVIIKTQLDYRALNKAYEISQQSLQEQVEGLRKIHEEELKRRDTAIRKYRETIDTIEENYENSQEESCETKKTKKEPAWKKAIQQIRRSWLMRLLMLMALSGLLSIPAYGEDPGRFTFLGQNQCAPYEGILFDPKATSTILADRYGLNIGCEARIKYQLDIQAADYELKLDNLQIRHDSLLQEYVLRVDSLERESDALAKALKRQSKKTPVLWVAVGLASGMAISYGAYRVFNEQ